MTDRLKNWAGSITYSARRLHRPTGVPELQQLVAEASRIRALGTRHSFSDVADTSGDLVTVAGLPPVVDLDADEGLVSVSAGLRYGEVVGPLHAGGAALHNLGSLPHISVAGACATGTHGSGDALGCLASAVRSVELVTAEGELVEFERGRDAEFEGVVVGLGALGVVTRLVLAVEPSYEVSQHVYDGMPLDAFREHAPEVFASGYSVSVFTDWRQPWRGQVWLKRRAAGGEVPAEWLGARLAGGPRHPVPGMPAEHCTPQGGEPGPWHTRLPHFRLEFTPSSGEELQSEWLLPRERLVEALDAVAEVGDHVAPVLQISELRTVAADDLWLSPAHGRDSVAFHFTWVADTEAVLPVVAGLDERLTALEGRPHWGKVSTASADTVRGLYPRLEDFQGLRRRLDPRGVFRNDYLDRVLPLG